MIHCNKNVYLELVVDLLLIADVHVLNIACLSVVVSDCLSVTLIIGA